MQGPQICEGGQRSNLEVGQRIVAQDQRLQAA